MRARGRRHDDDDLAARLGACRIVGRERRQVAAPHFLVQLCQFAAHGGFARAEPDAEIGECRGETRAALEQHQRRRHAGELGDARAARTLLWRQEAFEEEPVGRKPGDAERHQHRGGAGRGRHRVAGLARLAHELEAGIGDQRRAGVRDQRDPCAARELLQQERTRGLGVVVVIGSKGYFYTVMIDKPAAHPRVLAGDEVAAREDFERAQRYVAQVSDRRRHHVEPRREFRCVDSLSGNDVPPRLILRDLRLGVRRAAARCHARHLSAGIANRRARYPGF